MAIAEDFEKDGPFVQIKNLQIQDTVTAILCIGDPRCLDFTIHKTTHRKIEKICKSKYFDSTCGSPFVLYPNDKNPLVRQFCNKNEPSFFRHSCKGVAKGQMSLGYLFQVSVTFLSKSKS
jgi:hypothetical protein